MQVSTPIAVAALASALVAAGPSAAANVIVNGDFNANAADFVAFPGYSNNVNGSNPFPAEWEDVFGFQGVNGIGTDPSVGTPFGPTSLDIFDGGVDTGDDAENFAFLQVQSGFEAYMRQDVTLMPDTEYVLDFAASARQTGFDAGGNVLTVSYSADGLTDVIIGTFSQAAGDINSNNFTALSLTFTTPAVVLPGYLEFSNQVLDAGDRTVSFTDVSLTVVPEPTSLIAGLAGCGLLSMRRRR